MSCNFQNTLVVSSWLAVLQAERLEMKTRALLERVREMGGSWEDAYFVTLARSFGFGANSAVFEEWARGVPLRAVDHHRDDLFQVETLFLGQAGLLDRVEERYGREYGYLCKKFGLTPMDGALWRYGGMRPQSFPHRRVLQLAEMYHRRLTGLGALLDCGSVADIGALYGARGMRLQVLVVNAAVPTIFAYGRTHAKEALCERACAMLEEVRAEDNAITRLWAEKGVVARSAADSQALIQLRREYCERDRCGECRLSR